MTHAASIALPEADARTLLDALGDAEALGFPSVDMVETAPGAWRLTAYFEDRPDAAALDAVIRATLPGLADSFAVEELPETDWVAKSLAGLGPVRAGRFFVHGGHDRARRPANAIAVEIEANQAFGSGHHGTTAGCLAAMNQVRRRFGFGNLLDLGAGSGVLAIAAAKAWRVPALATEIDPVASRICAENATLNGVAGLVETVTADGFRHPALARRAPFDLIVANILAGPLVALAPALVRHLAPGGVAILSGLLPEQRTRVFAAYRNQGCALVAAKISDGWSVLTVRRRR